jgi:hypothetical protein
LADESGAMIDLNFLAKQSASILEVAREIRGELRANIAMLRQSSEMLERKLHPLPTNVVRGDIPARDLSIPNLDAMTDQELRECSGHFSTLAQYASLKGMAMNSRKNGRVADAIRTEAYLEKLYQLLPTEWRW